LQKVYYREFAEIAEESEFKEILKVADIAG